MNESDFEGTIILEKLAEINKLEEFMDAVDSDDLAKAKSLMRSAQIDAATIAIVLKKMMTIDSEH